jgi:hypothetical protein
LMGQHGGNNEHDSDRAHRTSHRTLLESRVRESTDGAVVARRPAIVVNGV